MKKSIITIALCLVSVSMVHAVDVNLSSYSLSELRALVVRINAQITELEKQQAKACFVSNVDLSIGDGEMTLSGDVKKLQDFLREKGFFYNKSTGYFGKLTRTALMSYQASVGLAQTGDFDAATRAKIHAGSCALGKEVKKYEEKPAVKEEKKKDSSQYVSKVNSIAASVSGPGISWTSSSVSTYGYKVVWSKTSGPTYPPREGDRAEYYEANGTKASLSSFAGSGTYYVRVCEYLNGTCGAYSNEVKVEL